MFDEIFKRDTYIISDDLESLEIIAEYFLYNGYRDSTWQKSIKTRFGLWFCISTKTIYFYQNNSYTQIVLMLYLLMMFYQL